jgi:hypothetical protein
MYWAGVWLVSEVNGFQRGEYEVTTDSGTPAVHASQNGYQQAGWLRKPTRNNEDQPG